MKLIYFDWLGNFYDYWLIRWPYQLFLLFWIRSNLLLLDWIIIALLIAIGITLIVVEVIFVPGTTIVGIMGFACAALGVYFTYVNYGAASGHTVLVSVLAVSVLSIVISLRTGMWQKFSHKQAHHAKVNAGLTQTLQAGDEGTTVAVLRPMGKASFEDKEYEVTTLGSYLEAGQAIKIIQIDHHKIIVEPIANI